MNLNKNYTRILGTDEIKTIDNTNDTQLGQIEADMTTIEQDVTTLETNNTGTNTGDGAEKDTAQWNADRIKGKTVDDSDIGTGKVLAYNASSGNIEYVAPDTPGAHASSHETGESDAIPELAEKVIAPATNTDTKIPQWDGANSKTLKDGLDFKDEDDMASDSATAVPSQQSVKAYVDGKTPTIASKAEAATGTENAKFLTPLSIIELYRMPEGYMYNGKISPSVASDNLTVALKTKAGTDPSASDPVYVMIGGTLRSVTAATTSVAVAGYNYCNSGSAELATKEVDYFVYLSWDATNSIVKMGFARIPYGTTLADFNATDTNEKGYNQNSTETGTDVCVNIGRFAATLSAGAGYTWSVPTFTASNLIQRPIYESRVLDFVSQRTGFTTTTTDCKYQVFPTNIRVWFASLGGTSNATGFTFTLPFASSFTSNGWVAVFGQDNGTLLSTPCNVELTATSATANAYKTFYDTAWTNSGAKNIWGHFQYPY